MQAWDLACEGIPLLCWPKNRAATRCASRMKHHLSLLAVAVVALETATASNLGSKGGGGAGAGGGQNWYLRAPDGSSQGPYALPQLGEWSSAGYVSPGELCAINMICDEKTGHDCSEAGKHVAVIRSIIFELPFVVHHVNGDLLPVSCYLVA